MKTSPRLTEHESMQDLAIPTFPLSRLVHWLGSVHNDMYAETVREIKRLLDKDKAEPITLVVTSPGGATGIAMSFYDMMRKVYRPTLHTIGSGDVDSSGLIIFLAGERRYITPHTTLFLHLAGRTFDTARRFSTADMESILKEDKLKDLHYASVVSDRSGGRLSSAQVLELMAQNTVLTAVEAKEYGLAHHILSV